MWLFLKNMIFKLSIQNKFGEFSSKEIDIPEDKVDEFLEILKNFYNSGFEMPTDDGILVIPPDLTRESILKIKMN